MKLCADVYKVDKVVKCVAARVRGEWFVWM